MLQATLDFAHYKMGDILEVLLSLPRELRPLHLSDDERRRSSLIGDQQQFIERTSRQGYGLLLSYPKVQAVGGIGNDPARTRGSSEGLVTK